MPSSFSKNLYSRNIPSRQELLQGNQAGGSCSHASILLSSYSYFFSSSWQGIITSHQESLLLMLENTNSKITGCVWNRHKMNTALELVLLPYNSHTKVLQSCQKCLQRLLSPSFTTPGRLFADFHYLQNRNIIVLIYSFDRIIDRYCWQLCNVT